MFRADSSRRQGKAPSNLVRWLYSFHEPSKENNFPGCAEGELR
jgi:hypothetical protein